MNAPTLLRHAHACLAALLLSVVFLTSPARAADLGANPSVGTGSLTLGAADTFTGTLSVGTTGQSGGTVTLGADYTTANALIFAGINSFLTYSGTARTLTLLANASFTRTGAGYTSVYDHLANQGTLTVSGGGTLFANGNLTNTASGDVTVTSAGSILALTGLANAGTLSATNNGAIQLTGTVSTSNLGTITLASGGSIELTSSGIINNTGSTLTAPTGGTYLFRGTITGGTVNASAVTFSSGILDGATLAGNASLGNATLTLKNGASFTDTLTVGLAGQSGGTLTLGNSTTTLAGSALVLQGINSFLSYTGTVPTLTITGNSTVTRAGAGYTSAYPHLLNQGTLTVSGGGTLYANGTFTNAAAANVLITGASSTLVLSSLANSGTVSAESSGLVQLNGNFITAGLGKITLATGGAVELTSSGVLDNTGATLTAPTGGTYGFKGTIRNGTVNASALTHSSGTLDGATLAGNSSVGNATLTLKNGAAFADTLTVGTTGQAGGSLYLGSSITTLSGSALVLNGTNSFLSYTGAIPTLTIAANSTVTRAGAGYTSDYANLLNQGTLAVNGGGTFYINANVTNQSAVTVSGNSTFSQSASNYTFSNAAGATATVGDVGSVLAVAGLANAGTLSADTGGLLQLNGNLTTAGLGTITLANGGAAELAGTLTNTSATLNAPTGGSYLFKGTIIGGTIAPNALTQSSGTLDGALIAGNASVGTATLTLKNNGGATGTLSVGTAGQSGGTLSLANSLATPANSALVLTGTNSFLTYTGAVPTLTLAGNASLTRAGVGGYTSVYPNVVNQGTLAVTGGTLFVNGNVANQSTVTVSGNASFSQTSSGVFTNAPGATASVSGAGNTLAVRSLDNRGTLSADTSGVLQLYGNLTTGGLGTISLASGGTVEVLGTLDNSAANLLAPSGGSYQLKGTITGGTIDPAALTPISGTLDGAIVNGDLAIGAARSLTLQNNAAYTGTATVGTAGQSGGSLLLGSNFTPLPLSTLTLTGTNSFLSYSGALRTLTLPATATLLRTGAGGYTSVFPHLINQGTVSIASGTLYTSGSVTNQTGSSFAISSGAAVNHSGPSFLQTGGRLTVDGTLSPGASGVTLQGGTLEGAGTISGNVRLDGASVAPGTNGLGTLTFSGGSLAVLSASAFTFDFAGASSDRLVFQNPPAVVDLGAGLVSLSLNFLAAPTVNTTYNLVQITTGGSGITGTFAGLPTSGTTFQSSYAGTSYFFTVNYTPNLVALTVTPVPEPSTVALLAAGLGLLGVHHFRRRR